MTMNLNTILTILTTQNDNIVNILCIPSSFIENALAMFLFTTILNMTATRKQKIIYVLLSSIVSLLSKFFIPSPVNTIINMISLPVFVFFILKTTIPKSALSIFMPLIAGAVIESPLLKIYNLVFNINQIEAYTIPIYRASFMLTYYLFLYILYRLCKKFKFNINMLDKLNKNTKKLFIANSIIMVLSFIFQSILATFYIDNLPISITIISMFILFGYYGISMYCLNKTTELEITSMDLEQTKQYNKTLSILHDNVRCFRHDFNNIVTTIGGYVYSNDLDGLKLYYSQLVKDCERSNNLSALNPDVINNPAIYSLLTNKYHLATELGITVNVDLFFDFNTLNMKVYEFTKILGILLDNAIEASNCCTEKIINITMRKDLNANRQLLIIENTYNNFDIDTEEIYKKNFSTKPNNSGLGLWEVRQILKKNNNLNLFTTKNDVLFKQQLEIYL